MSEISETLCWDCKSAWTCPQAVAAGMTDCSDYAKRPHPPGPVWPPDLNLARKLWSNTPPELHPKPWTSTDAKSQELADLRANLAEAETQLAGVKGDLRASTEQHVMDDDIIVGLRAKLAEAEAKLEGQDAVTDELIEITCSQYERAEQAEAKLVEAEARVEQEVARREAAVDEAQRMVDRYAGETCFWQEQAKHEGEFKAIYRNRFEQAEAREAALRAALKPFALLADECDDFAPKEARL